MGDNRAASSTRYIASVVTAYWLVSISMVYLNKFLLSNPDASIPAPLFVTWYQCLITCLIVDILGRIGNYTRSVSSVTKTSNMSMFDKYQQVAYKRETGMRVLPLSIIFVGMITFNNLCLQYVEVSFYNVARSLSIVFNVMFTYLVLQEKTSLRVCGVLCIVILGFIVGIDGEVNFSMLGTLCGVVSSVFVSLNSIMTKKISKEVDIDNNGLLFYNNANAVMLFLPLIAIFEHKIIMDNVHHLISPFFWFSMTITGMMGFSIGLVTVLQVTATSPLTHNISGTAKAAAQSILAFYIWGNSPTVKGILGIVLVLGGSGLYTYVQRLSMQQKAKPSSPSTAELPSKK